MALFLTGLARTITHNSFFSCTKQGLIHATVCCDVLQLLKQAAELGLLQADLVEPALAKSLQQDARGRSSQMSNRSCSLLTMMKQTAGLHWPQRLHEATASLLTEALLQHPHQPEIAHMFEDRTAASLVPSATASSATCQAHLKLSSICLFDSHCVSAGRLGGLF